MIGPYSPIDYADPDDAFRPYDARYPAMAATVIGLIRARDPRVEVEHVGSSAVPGCAGKGVIDLMVTYLPGEAETAKAALIGLGFTRYDAPGAWGEDRPVMIGTIGHDGDRYRVHAHVIAADAEEVAAQRRFRDRLRADPSLVAEYMARKRATLAAGVTDSRQYNAGKDSFIRSVIDGTEADTGGGPAEKGVPA